MIRLDPEALQRSYPQPSADFSARMTAMLHALAPEKEAPPMKRLPLRAAMIAVVLMALLSATALALTRPAVLDWLLGTGSTPSPQLEHAAQDIRSESTADGVTIRLTGLVYDGMQLAFSYEAEVAEPTQPALVLLGSDLTVAGQAVGVPHYVANTGDARLIPSPHLDILPVRRNPLPGGGWSNTISLPLTGTTPGEATFLVYRPEKAFAVLLDSDFFDGTIDGEYRAELDDALAALRSFPGVLLLNADREDAETWAAQGYTVLTRDGSTVFPVDDPRCHTVQTARITVPFAFDADHAFSCDFTGTVFTLPDCAAQVEQFLLTPLVTRIQLQLVPDANTEAAARALAAAFGPFTLTDEAGQPVTYSEIDTMYSMHPSVVCRDDQWLVQYWEELPGLQHFPRSIGFTVQTGELLRFDLNAE